eukprot:CAMPEP_0113937324 /NCGR_PEP_ID=MMETSP1339-20121228/3969_1 /TAXON_ID=94617 /ORGANISM="Fibrocapsa japonica" /LENGTH=187 /DNA_ID=CAMNT_0000940043 /DNA_START=79 /DNA_END=642 /DNA_ORIENTATION=- /assembly_acc=CAM_ASM_000762
MNVFQLILLSLTASSVAAFSSAKLTGRSAVTGFPLKAGISNGEGIKVPQIKVSEEFEGKTKQYLYTKWIDYIWKEGGTLGGITINEEGNSQTGVGCVRTVAPLNIVEEITGGKFADKLVYTVNNPGKLLAGAIDCDVSFEQTTRNGPVKIQWNAFVEPKIPFVPIFYINAIVKREMEDFKNAVLADN